MSDPISPGSSEDEVEVSIYIDETMREGLEQATASHSLSSRRDFEAYIIHKYSKEVKKDLYNVKVLRRLLRVLKELDDEIEIPSYKQDASFGKCDIEERPEVTMSAAGIMSDIGNWIGCSTSKAGRVIFVKGMSECIQSEDDNTESILDMRADMFVRKWNNIKSNMDGIMLNFEMLLRNKFDINDHVTIDNMSKYPGLAEDFAFAYRDEFKESKNFDSIREKVGEETIDSVERVLNEVSDSTGVEV